MRYFVGSCKDNLSCKFKNQIRAAQNIGLDVWYIAFENKNIFLFHDDKKIKLLTCKDNSVNSLIDSIKSYLLLYKAISKCFEINRFFDIVYIRSMPATLSMLNSLRIAKKNCATIILEIPTFPGFDEDEAERRFIRKALIKYAEIANKLRNKYVDYYALIGDKADYYMGKPAINIENGICSDFIPQRNPEIISDEIHCLGLASMSKWHGYDRFIHGLFEYRESGGKQKIILHLVGDEGDGSLNEWKKLCISYALEKEVLFEGALYGNELNELVNLCDLGIATLAGYRINMGNSSTLKVREYTARGLPFIYAAEDNAINTSLAFVLKVPNNDSPINMNSIIKFANETRARKDLVQEMRIYAQENMSWEKQFKKIINWVDLKL